MSPAGPRVQVLMAAQGVALSARTDTLDARQVDAMRCQAEELLPRPDPARTTIIAFATQYELERRDAAAVRQLGVWLQDEIARHAREGERAGARGGGMADPAHWPAPVDLDRSDVHG